MEKNINNTVTLLNDAAKHVAEATWTKILKVWIVMFFFLATIVLFVFGYNASRNEKMINVIAEQKRMDNKEENLRDFYVSPRIQKSLENLLYALDADRAFVFEFHNGQKNVTGLPFRFADMSYEKTNEERKITKVAMKYQRLPLTLYAYPSYMAKKKFFFGSVDEVRKIDSEFAQQIEMCEGKYVGIVFMSSNGKAIGCLCISYHSDKIPSRKFIENKLNDYDKRITPLLDLDVQMAATANMAEDQNI